ncbi:MAG TPA: ABC transporter permease [Myxococcota bacterium]|jgi:NitT/TauT family transport system permease protein|nr:ABC transporter permease [Myxococcota bacterium]
MAAEPGRSAGGDALERDLEGLDALDVPFIEPEPFWPRFWSAAWPRLAAIGIVLAAWQLVVWTGWRPEYVLPGPLRVFAELGQLVQTERFWSAVATTLRRAGTGFAMAIAIGTLLGVAVSRSHVLRRAFGSFITGLQSMPSIAWFPFAILLFKLSEGAILFVVIIGASPSIANGLISGIDHIPPLLLRAGRVLGARGLAALRHVVLPAALPGYVAGLKQGWAFSWRSLMAGELLVIIETRPALGSQLQFARELSDAPALLALMLVVLLIGILVDSLFFETVERGIRKRRGLAEA